MLIYDKAGPYGEKKKTKKKDSEALQGSACLLSLTRSACCLPVWVATRLQTVRGN